MIPNKASHYFVTGIDTNVGKTIASAILVKALQADYWKPIQAGDLDYSDTHKVKALVNQSETHFFDNSYALDTPMSPHAAAKIDEVEINIKKIKRPKTKNHLIIEGAGGLLVPLNSKDTIADLIAENDKVILVSRHYLGSINHSLLSIEYLKNIGVKDIGIIFSGDKHPSTEDIILSKTDVKMIGRIEEEKVFTVERIDYYANRFRENLLKL